MNNLIDKIKQSEMPIDEIFDRCGFDYDDIIDLIEPIILENSDEFVEFEEVLH